MIAGTVREADEVRVALDQPRHDGASVQIDDVLSRSRIRRIYSDRNEAAVADCHRLHHAVPVVHRVDAPVDEGESIISGIAVSVVLCLRVGAGQRCADARGEARLEEISPRLALVFLHTFLLYDSALQPYTSNQIVSPTRRGDTGRSRRRVLTAASTDSTC